MASKSIQAIHEILYTSLREKKDILLSHKIHLLSFYGTVPIRSSSGIQGAKDIDIILIFSDGAGVDNLLNVLDVMKGSFKEVFERYSEENIHVMPFHLLNPIYKMQFNSSVLIHLLVYFSRLDFIVFEPSFIREGIFNSIDEQRPIIGEREDLSWMVDSDKMIGKLTNKEKELRFLRTLLLQSFSAAYIDGNRLNLEEFKFLKRYCVKIIMTQVLKERLTFGWERKELERIFGKLYKTCSKDLLKIARDIHYLINWELL